MSLARILALPCWNGPPQAEPLHGGLSNEIWKVTDAAGPHVVRFGLDYPFHHVNRTREAMTTRAAHAAGFAPAVTHTEPGVMVTDFITSRTLGPADICNDPARIAHLLRRFHTAMPAHVTGEAYLFWVFHTIRDYARTLTAAGRPVLPALLDQATAWEAAQIPLPIIFAHNDLLPANFLDDGARLWLIDYEYAGFSTSLFDLAGAASNAGMTEAQSHSLLAGYFGAPPTPALIRAFDAMQCASLLREAMWAMVSDLHLSAPGVNYAAYADENIERLRVAMAACAQKHGPF
ncbi:MAG: phosphotransferase [Pseudomonadota bacterium]